MVQGHEHLETKCFQKRSEGGEAYRPERRVEKDMLFGEGGDMVEFPHDMGLASPFIRPRIDHRESYRS